MLPSVLRRCWLGGRKSIRSVKTEWWGAGVVICLERGADLHMAQLMPLPLTVSCCSKIQIGFTFPVPAHLGSPDKGPLSGCLYDVCFFYVWRRPVNFLECINEKPHHHHYTLVAVFQVNLG